MDLSHIELVTLDGTATTFGDARKPVTLVVNVASRCGLSPQYEALEALQKKYADRGFTVLGFPCNQFMFQEPGSNEEIQSYCSMTWGITFPMFDKVKVNGKNRHPLYTELVTTKDAAGKAGNVKWNFEKFLVLPNGDVQRFRPTTVPDDPAIIAAIETNLPR